MICDYGVDVNHRNKDDENALWTCCMRSGKPDAFCALIDAGIEVWFESDHDDILTEYLSRCESKGFNISELVIKKFLENGLSMENIKTETAKE